MKKRRPILIIGILGLLTLVIAGLIHRFSAPQTAPGATQTSTWSFIYDAVINIAFVLVGVFLADIVWKLVGGDPSTQFKDTLLAANSLLADSVNTGIVRVFSSSSDMGSSADWLSIIKNTKTNLCLQGYTLLVWTRSTSFSDTLTELVAKGVKIRIILMDPAAKHLEAGVNEKYISGLKLTTVTSEIKSMQSFLDDTISKVSNLTPSPKGSIEYICAKENLITSQILIADNRAFIIPYMSFFNTPHCPLYQIENSNSLLFTKYQQEFDKMWEAEKTGVHTSSSSPQSTQPAQNAVP